MIINLNCAYCGAQLEITSDMDLFACSYCGNQQLIERKGGAVYLKKVVDAISKLQVGIDKNTGEMAFKRLNEELKVLESNYSEAKKILNEKSTQHDSQQTVGCLLLVFLPIPFIATLFAIIEKFFYLSDQLRLFISISVLVLLFFCVFKIIANSISYKKSRKESSVKLEDLQKKIKKTKEEIQKQRAIIDS